MSRNRGGADWYSGGDIMPSQHAPHSKAPDMSQITCLTGSQEPAECDQPKHRLRNNSSEFVRLAKAGGHKDLLRIESNAPCEPVHHDVPSEWYYQQGIEPGESFSSRDLETPDEAKVKRPTNKMRVQQDDSEYVRLAKKGGHSDLLVIEENERSSMPQQYHRSADWYYLEDNKDSTAPSYTPKRGKGTSNPTFNKNDAVDARTTQRQGQSHYATQPIWLGGSGPEISHVPGKRFMKKEQQEAPFAMHTTSSATRMSRNPDKI